MGYWGLLVKKKITCIGSMLMHYSIWCTTHRSYSYCSAFAAAQRTIIEQKAQILRLGESSVGVVSPRVLDFGAT